MRRFSVSSRRYLASGDLELSRVMDPVHHWTRMELDNALAVFTFVVEIGWVGGPFGWVGWSP